MPPPDADAPRLRPLDGVERLSVGDVRMMLRPAFWLRPGCGDGIVQAHLTAAAVALAGLAGLPAYGREAMRADQALPDGRRSVVVRGLTGSEEHELAVRPAVAEALARLKRVHAVEGEQPLFIRPGSGDPYMCLWNAGRRLGSPIPLWRLLRNFFEASLYRSDDADAIDCYLSIVTRGDGDPHLVTPSALKRLVLQTDPLGGDVRWVRDDEYALKAALDAGTRLAATFDKSIARPKAPQPPVPPPPEDHPLLVEIAAAKPKSGQKSEIRLQICMRHMAELDRMRRDRSLPNRRAAELFGMTANGYASMLWRARRELGMGRRGPKPVPKLRPAMTPKEAARLARLSVTAWPGKAARTDFCRRLLAKHGDFVFGLAAAGKLGVADGAAIFGMSQYSFRELRPYAAAGMITARFARATIEERAKWRDIVLRELSKRPPGPLQPFIDGLRTSFGVPLPDKVIRRIVRDVERPPGPTHARGPIRMALRPDERAKLDALARAEWPAGPEAEGFRRHFIAEHADFVFGLLRGRRIGVPDAAKLFRISADQVTMLSRLHLEGLLAPALLPPPPPEERERRKLLVKAELPRRPIDMPAAEFARQMTRKLRFHVPAHWIIDMLRKGVPGAAPLPPFGKQSRPALDDGERARLRVVKAAIMEDDGRDLVERRRAVLRRDGSFLMTLLEGKKLGNEEAAELLEVNAGAISRMRCDFRDGTFAHHAAEPAPDDERSRWMAIAQAECRAGERRSEFVRRLRRMGAPLESHTLGRVFDAARAQVRPPAAAEHRIGPG